MDMRLSYVKFYSYIYGVFKDIFGVNLPGLGFAIRCLKSDLVLIVNNRKVFFNHRIGVCYARHFAGNWNEPETHLFLDYLILKVDVPITFIDIGANIGEFIIDVAKHNNVKQLYAFEPIKECSTSILKSCELNEIKNCVVYQKLAGKQVGTINFTVSDDITNSSVFSASDNGPDSVSVEVTTLDVEFNNITLEFPIILVDAEGSELEIIYGGRKLIELTKPLIIFEYNFISRRHFHISEVAKELGPSYELYRLRLDGKLDRDFRNAWNCVAVHKKSVFASKTFDLVQ